MKGPEVLELLAKGVKVSAHSDDPAYFGGYISDNYYALADAFNLTKEQVVTLAATRLKRPGSVMSRRQSILQSSKNMRGRTEETPVKDLTHNETRGIYFHV